MSATEVVHPLASRRQNLAARSTTRAEMSANTRRLVLYTLVGEPVETLESSASGLNKRVAVEDSFNAFRLDGDRTTVRLADLQRAFPLGDAYHFAFRNEYGVYVDLTNPDALVPMWQNKIVARVTPLVSAPEVLCIDREEAANVGTHDDEEQYEEEEVANIADASARAATEAYQDREGMRSQYTKFGSFVETVSPNRTNEQHASRKEQARQEQTSDHWQGSQSWNAQASNDHQYHENNTRASMGSGRRGSSSGGSGNAEWLRKQTEQAKDFAKKMSVEDAKKGATETAKKAKKWGASLLSSVSASIASAAASAGKSGVIQVGGVNVSIVRPLAEGAYAQVFLVRSNVSGESMALKRIICQSEEVQRDVQTELHVLQTVKHLNVVPLVEFSESHQQNLEYFFLFPFFERGSLWDGITQACESSSPLWPFNQRVALHLFRGICSGVLALHRAGFCHRDLKPHNVLLTSSSTGENLMTYIPVVTDFGSCAPLRVEVKSRRNSLDLQDEANRKSSAPYRAPELFEPPVDAILDGQSDVWSLGCILYAMAFGCSPFEHPREGFMKLACMNGRVTFPQEHNGGVRHRSTQFTHEFCDFIRDMLHTNPEERPSVLDALEFTEELLSDEMKR